MIKLHTIISDRNQELYISTIKQMEWKLQEETESERITMSHSSYMCQ
jgi:hypothetical protein